MSVQVVINGRRVEAKEGQTLLEAAVSAGIEIPTLCYHPRLRPVGSCRLCVVEVKPQGSLVASCTLPVREGLEVETESPLVVESRREILELLLEDYEDGGYAAGDRPATEFERWVAHYGLAVPRSKVGKSRFRVDSDPNPFLWVDLNKCILCTRCVRACAEIQGRFVWGVAERGRATRIVAGADTMLLEARCESCGACAAVCPTGALDDKPSVGRGQAEKRVATTCPYCGVGCQMELHVRQGRIVRVGTDYRIGPNYGHLCVKGRYGYEFAHHPDRLTRPMVRQELLEGKRVQPGPRGAWVPVSWETAVQVVADRLVAILRESGPDAVGVLSSAKCTNEENYLVQKLARQVLGTQNVDHCARLCHASTVAGLAACLGSGAMSNTMDDVADEARAMLLIGSNTTEQHPVFGSRIRQAVLRRGMKLVVADPRQIDLAEFAVLHLRQRPGTDVALINGLMHVILKNGWEDRAFIEARCEGFDSLRQTVAGYPPERVEEITGVPAAQVVQAAELLARNRPMAVVWAMGITQHTTGVLNVLSLGNLQMLLGNLGVPGGGVNPLRGQNNVQGACDMGALPNFLPGYQRVSDPAVHQRFADAWRLEAEGQAAASPWALPETAGLTVTEMISAAGAGTVRALVVVGENPAMTDPDLNHVRHCLEACEFLVVQEIFPSETAQLAHVLLPGSSWAEKSGTFTNTDRRVQRVRQALEPPGEALPDWQIVARLAQAVLQRQGRRPAGPFSGWQYSSPQEIMEEIAALTPIYAGVHYERLERGETLHWPVTGPGHPGTPILHVGRFTRGKGLFHAVEHLPPQELPDDEYPLVLTTGRVLYHWHGAEMTRRVPGLLAVCPDAAVEISPEDAAWIGLHGRASVRVVSRRGEMVAHALVTDRVPPGVVFGNFHFPGPKNINNVTIAALDPVAKIPEYKVCAVRVEPA